ncbi:MAG: hypothetical protein V7719_15240 [Psychroserpens sp.]|uniref:hypothetical protein n=1 Tax=Psychroserpens sp. TaxID=2020870 RepID=UPI0030031214
MALINCSECGSEVSDQSDSCIKCGNPFSNEIINKEYKVNDETLKDVASSIANGNSKRKIIKNLNKKGFTDVDTLKMIEHLKTTTKGRKILSVKYRNRIIIGFIMALIGSLIFVAIEDGETSASPFIPSVLLFLGLWYFIRGIVGFIRCKI